MTHGRRGEDNIGVDNKGVGLCDEAVPVQVRPKGGWESRDSGGETLVAKWLERWKCVSTWMGDRQGIHV